MSSSVLLYRGHCHYISRSTIHYRYPRGSPIVAGGIVTRLSSSMPFHKTFWVFAIGFIASPFLLMLLQLISIFRVLSCFCCWRLLRGVWKRLPRKIWWQNFIACLVGLMFPWSQVCDILASFFRELANSRSAGSSPMVIKNNSWTGSKEFIAALCQQKYFCLALSSVNLWLHSVRSWVLMAPGCRFCMDILIVTDRRTVRHILDLILCVLWDSEYWGLKFSGLVFNMHGLVFAYPCFLLGVEWFSKF